MTNEKVKFSIVSAYYKNEEMTKEFLDNLQEQCVDYDIEMILVNGASEPINHPFVTKRIDLEKNVGFSYNMNQGLKEATGDYIVIIGNDGFPQNPNWLEELLIVQDHTLAGIVAPQVDNPDFKHHRVHVIEEEPEMMLSFVKFYPAVCWLLTRSSFNAIGFFDERFGIGTYEDNDYIMRCLRKGFPVVVSHRYVLHHRCSQTFNMFESTKIMSENRQLFNAKWQAIFANDNKEDEEDAEDE